MATITLKGNHEDMMLQCLESEQREVWWTWLGNGGDVTLESFGVSMRFGGYSSADLADGLGQRRVDWLRSLPLYHHAPPYLFVHAGIAPGRALADQVEKDMLWIRHHFLDSDDDNG